MAHVRQELAFGSIGTLCGILGLLQIVLDSFALRNVLDNRLELERAAVSIK